MTHFREIFGTILTLGFDVFVILFVYFMLAKQIPVLAVALLLSYLVVLEYGQLIRLVDFGLINYSNNEIYTRISE